MNLTELENYTKRKMREHGLHDWTFKWEKTKRAMGRCWYHKKLICISKPLAELNKEEECIDTALHEIAHALAYVKNGETGHGRAWKRWCVMIGAKPQRCYSSAEVVNVPYKYHVVNKENGKYICGYHRRPKWARYGITGKDGSRNYFLKVQGVMTKCKLIENNS
jgi:predicted SprT family Zn-dependent metalloprotease